MAREKDHKELLLPTAETKATFEWVLWSRWLLTSASSSVRDMVSATETTDAHLGSLEVIMTPETARPASGRKMKEARQERIKSDKYIHVHCFVDTGRWGAWIREPKQGGKRFYVGTHLTDRLAARCQDRALLKLETEPSTSQPIKLNFNRKDYEEDEHLRKALSFAEFLKLLRGESRATYKKQHKTECLSRFLAEEQALGNLPTSSEGRSAVQIRSVNKKEHLTELIGESDDSTDHNDEEEDYEDTSADDGSSNVVPQCSTGSYEVQSTDLEVTHDEIRSTNDEPFSVDSSSVTSAPALSWNGKRRRTPGMTSDEKIAIEGMLLLSIPR